MNLILCADSSCPKKDTCCRYTTDPFSEIRKGGIRVEPTLKDPEEAVCSKYRESPVTLIKIKK